MFNIKNSVDILRRITGDPLLIHILTLCHYKWIDDFDGFNDDSINEIEKYIQVNCTAMNLEQRRTYLSREYLFHPEEFSFSPGMRNRMKTAINVIVKLYSKASILNRSITCGPFEANTSTRLDSMLNRKAISDVCSNLRFEVQSAPNKQTNQDIIVISDDDDDDDNVHMMKKESVIPKLVFKTERVDEVPNNVHFLAAAASKNSRTSLAPIIQSNIPSEPASKNKSKKPSSKSKIDPRYKLIKDVEYMIKTHFKNASLQLGRDYEVCVEANIRGEVESSFNCLICAKKIYIPINKRGKPDLSKVTSHNVAHFEQRVPKSKKRGSRMSID